MIKYRVNGSKINLPTQWNDLSFKQYMEILEVDPNKDYRAIISICTGISEKELQEAELENVEELLRHLSFTGFPAQIDSQPRMIRNYIIPRDIVLESLGQYEDMREVMKKYSPRESDTDLEKVARMSKAYPEYAAIYCQKIRDGKYDIDKAMKMVPEMWSAPCLEILSCGSFFLTRLSGLRGSTKRIYRPHLQLWKRIKRATISFLRILGFYSPSTR